MANLPKISDCCIREAETGICMCCNKRCDGNVSSENCAAMRVAYFYGYSTAENIALKNLDKINDAVDALRKESEEQL